MKVRAEAVEYAHTEKGRTRRARAYALVNETGMPLFVGLFSSEAMAAEFCKSRGWKLVEEERAA